MPTATKNPTWTCDAEAKTKCVGTKGHITWTRTPAHTSDAALGLAVHRDTTSGETWTVTHTRSGLAVVVGCRSLGEAQSAALRLATAGDFTQSLATLKPRHDLRTLASQLSHWPSTATRGSRA